MEEENINNDESVIPNKVLIEERLKEEYKIFKKRCKGCLDFKNGFCADFAGENEGCNFRKQEALEDE